MSGSQASRIWILSSLLAVLCVAAPLPAQSKKVTKRPRRVFIPIEDLGVVIDRDGRGVMLEKGEYTELRALAARNEATLPRVPAALVLREVIYTARPSGDQLLIDASIRFQQFASGWQSLRLPLRGVSVERAVLDGKPARVARFQVTRNKATVKGLELFHETVGTSALELGLSTPLASVGSDRVAAFGLVPAATATLVVHLPAGKHLLVDGLAVRRPAAADQPATYNLPVGGRSDIRLAVTDRQTQRAGDSLVFASTAFGIGVAPGEVTWQAVTGLEVFGEALDVFVASVPRTLEITDVASSGLENWELADDPDNPRLTRITLRYRQRFTGSRRVTFRGVMTTAVGQMWQVPRLRLSGITSHIGQVLVHSPPGVRLQAGQATGVRRVSDVTILAKIPAGSSVMQFDAWREDFNLSFATETKRQELQAALATILSISDDGLDLVTDATIESLFSSLFQVDFSLPEGWNVTEVKVAGKPVSWQRLPGADGRQRLRVGFAKAIPEGTEVSVSVQAHHDLENWPLGSVTSRQVPLPDIALEIGGSDPEELAGLIVEGRYLIRAPDVYDVVADDLVGLDQANLKLPGQRLGYMYQAPRVSGTLRIGRRPPRVSAESLTVARLDRETFSAHLESHLDIKGGGLRAVVVELPEWVGSDLRFRVLGSSTRIVEQLPSAAKDGRRRFRLKLDEFARNRLSLAVDLTMARDAAQDDASRFPLPTMTVIGAERDNGFVAIEAADDQRIDVMAFERSVREGESGAKLGKLAEIDPIDLPVTSYRPRERIVKAYRYLVPGYQVSLGETRFDHGTVARAVCHSSTVTSILARTGHMQHRASFDLTAAGVQSLVVDLRGQDHEQRSLWAVTVDGRPVKAHRRQSDSQSKTFVVGWPVDAQGAGRHTLQVFYRSELDHEIRGSDRLVQNAPVVSLKSGTGEPVPIEVLEQDWVLHHPWQTLVVASDGRFIPSDALNQVSLLGAMRDSMGNLSPGNLLSRLIVLVIMAGAIGILTLAFRRRRYVGLVTAAGALMVVGLVLPAILLLAPSGMRRLAPGSDADVAATKTGESFGNASPMQDSDGADAAEGLPMASMGAMGGGGGFGGGGGMGGGFPGGGGRGGAMGGEADMLERAATEDSRHSDVKSDSPPTVTRKSAPMAKPQSEVTRRPADKSVASNRPSGANAAGPRPGERTPTDLLSTVPAAPPQTASPQSAASSPDADPASGPAAANLPHFFEQSSGFQSTEGFQGGDVLVLTDGAVTRGEGRGRSGAVMSLALELRPPAGTVKREFHFLGSRESSSGSDLDIAYQDFESQSTGRSFIIMLVVVACWFYRQRRVVERLMGVIGGLVAPLALVTILPPWCHMYLDGLFLGAAAGTGLWLAIASMGWFRSSMNWVMSNLARDVIRAGSVLLAVSLLSAPLWAQAKPKPKSPAVLPPLAAPLEVVPLAPGQDPRNATRVLLPRGEFQRLWNLAHPERRVLPAAPRPGVVSHASWTARVLPSGKGVPARVAIRGDLQMYSFRDGQVVLSIPIGPVAIGGARLNGKPAPLVTRAKPGAYPLAVVLNGQGSHRFEIDCEVPLVQTGPAGQFTVTLGPSPVGRFSFELPDSDLLVRVNGSTTRHRLKVVDDTETIELGVDAGGVLRLAWQPKQAAEAADGVVQLESYTSIHVADPGVKHRSHYRFRVRQGGLPEASFELPASLSVQQVTGADVGGWDVETDGDERRLNVFFRRRVDDETVVRVELFQDRRVGERPSELVVDSMGAVGFPRDKGQLAIFVDDQFVSRTVSNSNLRQVDVAKSIRPSWCGKALPLANAKVVVPPRLVYSYITRPYALSLRLTRRTPEARAVARHAVRIEHRKVRMASRIAWQLSQAARASVTFALPVDYLPVSVEATALADWFVHIDEDGNRRLTVEFDGPRTGAIEVALEGVLPRATDIEELELALPIPLGLGRQTIQIMVWLDEAFSASVAEGGGWRSIHPSSADRDLRQLDLRKARFAFVQSGTNTDLVVLKVKRAVPGLQATVVSLVTVTDTLVDHSLALSWQITQAAADEFVFTTPGWLRTVLQFNDPRIREVRSHPVGNDPDGPVRWIVTLNEPEREKLFLIAQAILPPPSAGSVVVESPRVVFEQSVLSSDAEGDGGVSYKSVEIQERYSMLINQSTGTLSLKDSSGVERVEKEDLGRLQVRIEASLYDQATEMWRVLPRAKAMPVWNYVRSSALKQTTAKVQLAELVSVLAADGSWRTEAIYTIRNRAQQFLAVRIPGGSRVLSVSVNGVASRPVDSDAARAEGVVLVALPNTSEGDLSFPVRMIVAGQFTQAGKLPSGFHLFADKRAIPVPSVVAPITELDDDSEPGPFAEHGMKVEETSWTVHLPSELDVVPVEGDGTNLALVGSERIELNQKRAALDDANYLLGVLESKSSEKAKYKAALNLKDLGVEMRTYQRLGDRRRPGLQLEERDGEVYFEKQNEDFQARYRKTLDKLQVDDSKQRVTIVDESGSMEGQDEQAQKAQIFRNNYQLWQGNSMTAPEKSERESGRDVAGFNFKLKLPASKDGTTLQKGGGKKGDKGKSAGGVVSGKLATRELRKRRQAQSLSQIAGLNALAVKEEQKKVTLEMGDQKPGWGLQDQLRAGRFADATPTLPPQVNVGGRGSQQADFNANGLLDLDVELGGASAADVAGGLSVDFEIPTGGQTLQFATTGDNPKLELSMRPRESIQQGLNLLWTIAWLAVGSGVIVALRRQGTMDLLKRHLAKGLIGVGLISYLLLPGGWVVLGFLLFVVGLIVFAVQNRVAAGSEGA